MRGRQSPGPEWVALCIKLRTEFLKVCPLENRRFHQLPGTFRRIHISHRSGVSLANISRLVDKKLPVSPETVVRLAEFLGMSFKMERTRPLPVPGGELERRKVVLRSDRGLPMSQRTRRRRAGR